MQLEIVVKGKGDFTIIFRLNDPGDVDVFGVIAGKVWPWKLDSFSGTDMYRSWYKNLIQK